MAVQEAIRPAKRKCPDEAEKMAARLVWVDCEMSGLDVNTEHLLEVACLITEGDHELTIVAEGPSLVIHQPDAVLDGMVEWCKKVHAKSGLTEEVRKSTLTTEEAEKQLLDFVKAHVPEGVCPLSGNTCGSDRAFLKKYMPNLASWLHYRNVDVSSFKELIKRLSPHVIDTLPVRSGNHRAMEDIKESRLEMLHYIKVLFPESLAENSANK